MYAFAQNQVPSVSGPIIQRPRLLEKLREAAHYRLTILSAPPGYGKTTLVAQFIREAPCFVAWHTLEESERNLSDLYAHTLSALAEVVPDIQELNAQPDASPGELAGFVTHYLRHSLTNDLIYALDDVHQLIGSPAGEAWLRAFVTLLPPRCHLVLIGRAMPNLPIAEMVSRRQVMAVGQDLLRFTFAEIDELAATTGAQLPKDEIQRIFDRLGGWPAGTFLALQPLPVDLEQALLNGRTGPEALFDALAEAMLAGLPSDLRDFLLASSTLSQMTPDLCQNVLHLPESLKHFTAMINRNLFTMTVPGGVVYHPLFRDFLQKRFEYNQPVWFLELHAAAGRWFEAENHLETAIDHYVAAQQWEIAATIAERAAQAYFAQGKIETLLKWDFQLKSLRLPRLLHTCAMIHSDRYQYDQASLELEEASEGFQARGDEIGLMKVQLLQAHIDYQRGGYPKAIDQMAQLIQSPTIPENLRATALGILGIAELYSEKSAALQHLEEALALHRTVGDVYATSQILLNLDVAYSQQSRYAEAEKCLQEVVAIRRTLGSKSGLVMALNNLGYHYHLLGSYDEALLTFQDGLNAASQSHDRRAEGYLLWSLGDLQRDCGRFGEAARSYYKALEVTGHGEPTLECGLLTSLSILRRWENRLDEALILAQKALTLAEERAIILAKLKARLATSAVRGQQGDYAAAQAELDALALDFQRRQDHLRLAQVWGLSAHLALLRQNKVSADRCLKQIASIITHPASYQLLTAEILHTPLLKDFVLRRAERYGAFAKAVKKLEDAQSHQAIPRKENTVGFAASTTYSLRVFCLGQEHLERDGVSIPSSAWKASAARELFFYLLFKGAARREQICLDFWPDYSPQRVRRNFHTTLFRSRQAVGNNVIVFEDDLYRINPQVALWCDALELEAFVQQARLLAPRTAQAENLWRRAADLYKGSFLPSFSVEWADAYRETLNELYLEALVGLGNSARAMDRFHEALSAYEAALALDPYCEEVHRLVITCFAQKGERHHISSYMRNLENVFLKDLGIGPSEETLALARSLVS